MSTITFKDTNETFKIMAQDERYIICQRPYTVEERDSEIKKWSDGLNKDLMDDYEDGEYELDTFEEYYENSLVVEEVESAYKNEVGDCPEEISEDTFCYTIVDLQTKKRAPDNYYCKFNYDKKEECEIALKELNTITKESKGTPCEECEMQLSRRNSIELSEYEITNKKPYISGFEVEM